MDYDKEVIYCWCGWRGLDSEKDINFRSHVSVDGGGDHCMCSQTEWELRREIISLRERLSQTSALLKIYERKFAAPGSTETGGAASERRLNRRRHAQANA